MSTAQEEPSYRILMVAPTSFFADYGCHVRILEEARVLQKLGHKITIVTYYKGRDLPNLAIVRTRPVPWRTEYEVGSSRHKIGFDVLLSWTALKLVLRQRFDLIHAHLHEGALIGSVLAKLRGIPLVFDFQGSMTSEMTDHNFLDPDGLWYKPMLWLERHINQLPQVILTSSQHAANLLEQDFGCAPQCIHPVPDAVNLDFFRPGGGISQAEREAWKASLGIPPKWPVVVYLGLLTDYQGVDKLLHAAAVLRDRQVNAHFLIMGYPAVAHYRQMAADLGLQDRVTFTGKVPYDEAPRHLALGDIAAAPKLSDTEGSGKILNYMAMTLPTVAFDMPVSREFLGGLGVYAEREDAHGLADALQSLIADPDWAKALGRRLRQRAAERYAWDQAGRNIASIYNSLFQATQEKRVRHKPTLAVSNQQHKGKN